MGAETESKIKTGTGELRLAASGCYYTFIMRNGEEGGSPSHLDTP